ncbi:MAG: benzoyl-CoA 2,3-epoxidase subunit BoxA [Rhizobiales bacterium]|nr:benzoyl-CoA 2,3-epoxidase subunit BoxA [Hyphomicrobiales bacterium]
MNSPLRQHLIDPEMCIRCGTCEETCPIGAVSHNDDNYVVDAEICELCVNCILPCPTGSIDHWRIVKTAYSLEEQFSWDELPEQAEASTDDKDAFEALDEDVVALLKTAHSAVDGGAIAPDSAATPSVNLYTIAKPAIAKVAGNMPITDAGMESDIRHIVLDFENTAFPVLEGQSIGIIPPGTDERGKPHRLRLYSISSPRDGERPNFNNLALTVKRHITEVDGEVYNGVASNYLCDLERGAEVTVTGPYGSTFLMPNDPDANIIMICTGTGSAPFRAFTERRRRAQPNASGKMIMFFGARRPEELPYFGPLKKVPTKVLEAELVFSRLDGEEKEYVQDRMRQKSDVILELIESDATHIYICGLKEMESGVGEALNDICRRGGDDWETRRKAMLETGRYHVETY